MTDAGETAPAPTSNQTCDLSHWSPCKTPGEDTLGGHHVRMEPLDWDNHGAGLFAALCGPEDEAIWAYMPIGPFADLETFRADFTDAMTAGDWRTMVISHQNGNSIVGMASYMRIRAAHGSAEVGCIAYASHFQRTTGATEAMALMAGHVFDDLGYRRYEWKCNDRNDASMRAALRYGFIYEGTFRNDLVVKGRNRDTAWFAMIDRDWPTISTAYARWLADDNFDPAGGQKKHLNEFFSHFETDTACPDA